MRYQKKEIKDRAEIDEILTKADVGRLGLCVNNQPYIVPVQYVYLDGKIYIHSAMEGRKISHIEKNPNVCFEVDEYLGMTSSSAACNYSTRYRSVIVFGKAKIVNEEERKLYAVRMIFSKYVPQGDEKAINTAMIKGYKSSLGSKLAVIEIIVTEVTGKKS